MKTPRRKMHTHPDQLALDFTCQRRSEPAREPKLAQVDETYLGIFIEDLDRRHDSTLGIC